MTINNFILHPELPRESQRTDTDIYGVRFPYRRELKMHDDNRFASETTKPLFVIAEIKAGECKLNGPWTDPSKGNMQYVLSAMGMLESSLIESASFALYEKYAYEDEKRKIKLLTIGKKANEEYTTERPELDQLLFADILKFIYKRFNDYRLQKRDHEQWDSAGRFLYRQSKNDEPTFIASVLAEAGIKEVIT